MTPVYASGRGSAQRHGEREYHGDNDNEILSADDVYSSLMEQFGLIQAERGYGESGL